ncbi:Plant invertase/pectin methylesterase inhibitor superfamily protein [Arabidopsis thaliana]|uniref:Plant invertase/pectin methylesterase inhibitor superfamily protein n=3 Tax=Arabidopsis thaliana TaxID=3702 RepID=Q0WR80_ARATH|nr:Plant invertase/pectin methylesterase inhibitor superfamily protein [Arabidopsis thaliana]AEE75910.1 Plant invertase/pectin methylesterase inhibitor superfamily protein [Arabidopsis thaliana]BAF00369.1 hypothetical protein [Arabidopsis thaliana]|eukprot:NP_188340.3 Plant invertase/pectin methylesterase inhibitor superfamily protein [Arabidopsis thaliana]
MHYQIKTMMKLFSIFVVFMQIQVALSSQPIRYATEPKPIQELCKFNINPSLCVSTLNLDPRSKNSNLRELAWISIDATSNKVNKMLNYLISVSKNIKDREDLKKYKTCIDDYGTAARRFLPAALDDLKAGFFSLAKSDMESVVSIPDHCEAQFGGSSPLTGRNKATHDIANMTADIIRYLFGNN